MLRGGGGVVTPQRCGCTCVSYCGGFAWHSQWGMVVGGVVPAQENAIVAWSRCQNSEIWVFLALFSAARQPNHSYLKLWYWFYIRQQYQGLREKNGAKVWSRSVVWAVLLFYSFLPNHSIFSLERDIKADLPQHRNNMGFHKRSILYHLPRLREKLNWKLLSTICCVSVGYQTEKFTLPVMHLLFTGTSR